LIFKDYLDYTNPWALGALAFAGIGLVMTTITMGRYLDNCQKSSLKFFFGNEDLIFGSKKVLWKKALK